MNRNLHLFAGLAVGALGLFGAGCSLRTSPTAARQPAAPEAASIAREPIPTQRTEMESAMTEPIAAAVSNHEQWTMIWNDEFDTPRIDSAKWSFVVAGGGFGNNELQHYTDRPENAYIENGCLIIQALKEKHKGHDYTSAKIFSQGKGDWTYGRFEVRAQLPAGQGLWPAIWLMPTDYQQYGPWPSCGEIDLAEVIGSQPGTLYGTLHYGHPWKNSGVHYVLPDGKRFADDFHRFALEWAPGRIKWFVDDIYFGDQTNWYTSAPGAMWPAPFDRAFYIQFNLAVGGNWPGRPDDTTPFPARMRIDYVRVYKFNGEYPPVEKRSAAPLELRPRDPLPDGNLVYNGDFAEGRKCWEFETFEGAQAAMEAAGGVAKVTVARAGPALWNALLFQKPLNMERGKVYQVSFEAWADAPRELGVKVGKASQHWDNYSGETRDRLGLNRQAYTFKFKMRHPADPVARLEFHCGDKPGTVFIGNVRVATVAGDLPLPVDRVTRIPAANFDAASNVRTEACAEGGLNVGWISADDWMEYAVDVLRPGVYRVALRHAGASDSGEVALKSAGRELVRVALPRTGDWQRWATAKTAVSLPVGPQRLRVECIKPGFNLAWIELTSLTAE